MNPENDPNAAEKSSASPALQTGRDHIKDLFADASDLPADLRDALMQQRCGEDRSLRMEVERLLAAHDAAGRFLAGMPGAMELDSARASQLIGRYQLLEKIGEGGFGTVYVAEQQYPVRRRVALKIIKPGMDSRPVIARFEAERQALAMMDHPNIARVLDAGATDSGSPYFVMELVDGVPITRYCDEQQLNPRQRLELFIAVCNGLQHAHQKGIIHRDIKPSNILVITYDAQPVPKIIDFGVAKALTQKLTDESVHTQFGTVVGTLDYMSPEQTHRDAAGTDTRSDIYSMGVVLYELLAGSTPLESKTLRDTEYADVLRMIREAEPPKPSTRIARSIHLSAAISAHRNTRFQDLKKMIFGDLDWIVMKALEKNRARRYASASELARDIQRYLAHEPIEARPPSALYRFRKFTGKHRAALSAATAMLLLLVCATAFSSWQAIRATRAGNAMHEQLKLTTEAKKKGMLRLFEARLAQAKASHLSRRSGQRLDSLETLAEATRIARDLKLPPESFLEIRNVAIACLALTDVRLGKQWPGWQLGTDHIDFDGNLEHYARTDKQGAVSIRNVAGDVEIATLPALGYEAWPRFSSDGRFLFVGTPGGNKVIWKLGASQPTAIIRRSAGDGSGFDFSPDSKECAFGDSDGAISIYDLNSGRISRHVPTGGPARYLHFHPNQKSIAVVCDGSVEVRDLDSGRVSATVPTSDRVACLAWSPGGNILAVACDNQKIYLWNTSSASDVRVLEGIGSNGIEIAFNHSGNLLASVGWEGMLRLWDPGTGRQLFSTQGGNPPGMAPRFSRDDHLLAVCVDNGKLGFWEIASGDGVYRTLARKPADHSEFYECPAIERQGSLLAVGMQDGMQLWDIKNGVELGFTSLPGYGGILAEPSGDLLTTGPDGLLRWPVRWGASGSGKLKFGPPVSLPILGRVCHIACSRDGKVIAVSQFDGARVLHAGRMDAPVRLEKHEDARYVAVSPDGCWVATGSQTRSQVKIWDSHSGELVKELNADGSHVGFSPNGKWLATTAGGLRLWSTESWELAREIGGGAFEFSPDSQMIAVETGLGVVRLVDPATGREYASLEDPSQNRAAYVRFSPDGTQLILTGYDTPSSIHIWDLRKIRSQLDKLGLDWNQPAFGPERPNDTAPLHIDFQPTVAKAGISG